MWQAEQHPDVGLIGCEPYMNGVAKCLAHIERTGVGNMRLFTDDARLVMDALPDRSLSRAFVLFPDPWPKTRHHKRRFVQRDTLDILAACMKPGAELRLATDDPSYLPWMVEHACTHPAFDWLAERPGRLARPARRLAADALRAEDARRPQADVPAAEATLERPARIDANRLRS